MSQVPLSQPPSSGNGPFDRWIFLLWKRVSSAGQLLWSYLDFSGSNLTDLETRNHADLQNINTTNYYHLTQANHTDLTDGGDSTLHYHASDRARANHTGTQDATTVTVARTTGSTYSTVQHFANLSQSAGQISGGEITDAGGGTVNVAAGTGWLRISDDNVSELRFVDWAASSGISIPSGEIRYIGVEYNGGSPRVVSKTSDTWDEDTDFQLGEVFNESGELHINNDPWWVADSITNVIQRFTAFARILRDNTIGGLILGETGTRYITVSAGRLWSRLNDYTFNAIDTSVSGTFDAYYRNGSGGFTHSPLSQWPNTQYDDGSGTLVTMGNNKYACLWFYAETDGDLVMMYGQNEYNSAAAAELESPPGSVPGRLSDTSVLIARLIFQKSAATATSISSAFNVAFTAFSAANHNDLSGLQGGAVNDYYHFTSAQHTDLTDGGDSSLHYHSADRNRANHTGTQTASTISDFTESAQDAVGGALVDSASVDFTYDDGTNQITAVVLPAGVDHSALSNLNSANYYHLTQANHADLTDGGDSSLHYHSADRNRANHTGTQTASTISDFDTEVSNNTDVAANTAARHAAVTVTDSTSINLTLTGQDVKADAIFGTTSGTVAEGNHNHSGVYQPEDADLTAIAGLSLTANQVLGKDAAGTGWEGKTITAGSNVTVTHGANSITIAATGGSSSSYVLAFAAAHG